MTLDIFDAVPSVLTLQDICDFGRAHGQFSKMTAIRAISGGHLKAFRSAGTGKVRVLKSDFITWFIPPSATNPCRGRPRKYVGGIMPTKTLPK